MSEHSHISREIQHRLRTLSTLRMPKLRAAYRQIVGAPTQLADRAQMLAQIGQALASPGHQAPRQGRAAQRHGRAAARPARSHGGFAGLSVEDLRAKYREVIGRETGSRDRAYLEWKLREAAHGRIPLGPRRTRPAVDMITLPFRVAITATEAIDDVWRAHGVKSRNRFLQDAVAHYLHHLGATEAAKELEVGQTDVS